jgi:hypothetical protein
MNQQNIITPTPAQKEWHDMELGMFFHFDIPIYKQGWDWRSWKDRFRATKIKAKPQIRRLVAHHF